MATQGSGAGGQGSSVPQCRRAPSLACVARGISPPPIRILTFTSELAAPPPIRISLLPLAAPLSCSSSWLGGDEIDKASIVRPFQVLGGSATGTTRRLFSTRDPQN
ncbi:hypothetical protein E2562_038290 [Oryza meyeriana var. granulata]|uniref:Uncharacterized protein n=1 Tax=Oryza meyeriana var. granulata TaxID=110450 RepID=A0A6G1C2S5_9ORYZ|nr:hypothetical protein E2562_038290 [Oryza meyeriana var. granulata]